MYGTIVQLDGHVADGFGAVRHTFARQLPEVGDGGAAFAAVAGGQLVVDLWAGRAGRRPWSATTRAVLMSATKGVAATAVARLAERALLDVESPVAAYWPEFAAAGKAEISIAQLLSHSAGLISVPGYTELLGPAGEGWEHTGEIVRRLESAAPWWTPGSAHGYHGLTFGWLVGELIRRVTGLTAGTVIREEIAAPLGLELDVGTPPDQLHLVAPVVLAGNRLTSAIQDRQLADPSSNFANMLLATNHRCIVNTADVFVEVPHWDGDQAAIGLGNPADPRFLVYLSVQPGDTAAYLECEVPAAQDASDVPYDAASSGVYTDYRQILAVIRNHLAR